MNFYKVYQISIRLTSFPCVYTIKRILQFYYH